MSSSKAKLVVRIPKNYADKICFINWILILPVFFVYLCLIFTRGIVQTSIFFLLFRAFQRTYGITKSTFLNMLKIGLKTRSMEIIWASFPYKGGLKPSLQSIICFARGFNSSVLIPAICNFRSPSNL